MACSAPRPRSWLPLCCLPLPVLPAVAERLPLHAAWWTPARWTPTVPDASGRTWKLQVRPRRMELTLERVSARRE